MEACFSEWQISADKVPMVVSDNWANMIKEIKILAENAETAKSEETSKTEDNYEEAISDDGET